MNHCDPLLIIKASAGTGKTHALVHHYIKSIFHQGVDGIDFKKVLALTFTRSATGEIRDRILEVLAQASVDEGLRENLSKELGFSIQKKDVKKILKQMLFNMDLVNIQTIDSFLNNCASMVSSNINLPVNWSIILGEDDEDEFSKEAFDIFIENLGNESDVARVFREFEEDRSIVKIKDLIKPIKNAYEIQQVSSGENWSFLDISLGQTSTDFSQVRFFSDKNNFYFQKILEEEVLFNNKDWRSFVSQGIAGGVFKGIRSGIAKYGSSQIPDDIFQSYLPIVLHACLKIIDGVNLRTKQYKRFAKEYFKACRILQGENGMFSFEEICWRLKTASGLDILNNFYISTDSNIDHVLIDEFQDTSQMQFSVLYPIIDQIVSDRSTPRSVMAVGDIKQSIYGWRGGEPALLDSLTDFYENHGVLLKNLNVNYRSSEPIIKSVNMCFSRLNKIAQTLFYNKEDSHLKQVFESWSDSYEPLVAKNKGYFGEFKVLSSDFSTVDSVIDETINQVNEFVRRGNGSVAVLLRTNKHIKDITTRLSGLVPPVTVSGGEGKVYLSDSPVVLLLISLIRAIEFPADLSSRVHIENSPIGLFFKNKDVDDWLSEKKYEISTFGFIETMLKVFDPIRCFMDFHDKIQIQQAFRHIAVIYKKTRRLSSVLDSLTKHRESTSQGSDVSLMTIHQSKGLDFDYVVLPVFPRESFYKPKSLAVSKDKHGVVDFISSWPNKKFDLLWEDHVLIRKNDESRQCRESICLQYVGMTRAKYGVGVIIPPRSKNPTKTVDQMIRCAFSSVQDNNKDEKIIYLEKKSGTGPNKKPRAKIDIAQGFKDKILNSRVDPEIHTIIPSLSKKEHGVFFSNIVNRSLIRGVFFHNILKNITWISEGLNENCWIEEARKAGATKKESEMWTNQLFEILEGCEIRKKLKKPTEWINSRQKRSVDVLNELPVVGKNKSGVFCSGVVDRLELYKENDVVLHVNIIDWKSDSLGDQLKDDFMLMLKDLYKNQILEYKNIISDIYSIEKKHIQGQIFSLSLDDLIVVE